MIADQAAYWDRRTDEGEMLSSGTYFYQLQAGDYKETRKMVMLKWLTENCNITSISA